MKSLLLLALTCLSPAIAAQLHLTEPLNVDEDLPIEIPLSAVKLNPQLEGIYDITVRCDPSSPTCDPTVFPTMNRLTITDTRRPYGVWVTFANAVIHDINETFTFADVGPADNRVSGYPRMGTGFGNNRNLFSYFELTVDPVTGDIQGYFIFTRNNGTYRFHGRSLRIIRDVLRPVPAPLRTDEILGTYHGQFGTSKGKLILTLLPDGNLLGSYSSDEVMLGVPSLTFTYTMNSWDPALGLIRLVFINPRFFALGGMNVYIGRNASGQLEIDGFQYTVFANYPIKMNKVP